MSGTSLDGVDAVLVRLACKDGKLEWRVLARTSAPYPSALRGRLRHAMRPATSDIALLTQLHAEVGHAYADLAARGARKRRRAGWI